MCGRYTQTAGTKILENRFKIETGKLDILPRYNIAPSQRAPLIIFDRSPQLTLKTWGLIPPWARKGQHGAGMINARSETAAEKSAYRQPFEKRRCLVLADGFYEWRKSGEKGPKTPLRFARKDRAPFAFAGLWEGDTFTILTTDANGIVRQIHNRMPVILHPKDEAAWIHPETDLERVQDMLVPFQPEFLDAVSVSTRVNSPANDDAGLLEPVAEAQPELGF